MQEAEGILSACIYFSKESSQVNEIDKVDAGILERLQRDGRLSNSKLAEQISLSETPCWRRVKRLEELGVIDGYQAILNRRKLGLGVMAFVQLVCTQHGEEVTAEFEKIIQACPNVLACHNTTGEADFLLQVVAKDLNDYSHFVDTVLRKLPGVSSIRSNLSLRELKASNRLPVTEVFSV
jgi:DNA-binding Lrp family transcriptional regulator